MTSEAPSRDWLQRLPGVPESRLASDVLARLPGGTPAPPWRLRLDAVLWVQRPHRLAAATLPGGLRARRGLGFGIAGFVDYAASPVGPYREFLASPTLVRGGLLRLHVPLIAVDSSASLLGGRAHWALPKMPATFSGGPRPRQRVEARGDGWQVRADVTAFGPTLPVLLRASVAQPSPDGTLATFPVTVRGRVRLGRVDVRRTEDSSFARWLRPGKHPALLLRHGRMRLPAARLRRRS
jgi:hypothetical protein